MTDDLAGALYADWGRTTGGLAEIAAALRTGIDDRSGTDGHGASSFRGSALASPPLPSLLRRFPLLARRTRLRASCRQRLGSPFLYVAPPPTHAAPMILSRAQRVLLYAPSGLACCPIGQEMEEGREGGGGSYHGSHGDRDGFSGEDKSAPLATERDNFFTTTTKLRKKMTEVGKTERGEEGKEKQYGLESHLNTNRVNTKKTLTRN